jgi:hypothetical protein
MSQLNDNSMDRRNKPGTTANGTPITRIKSTDLFRQMRAGDRSRRSHLQAATDAAEQADPDGLIRSSSKKVDKQASQRRSS